MIFPDTFRANWQAIYASKARKAVKGNLRENSKRSKCQYQVGMYAYVTSYNIYRKLSAQNKGPFHVNEDFTNSTVKIQRGPIEEQINIRRLIPFEENV